MNIIQMVTGVEGSIMECHPELSLLPKAAMFSMGDIPLCCTMNQSPFV